MTETDLYDLGERFHNLGIFVAVHLYGVDKRHFRLWVITERLENFRESLEKNKGKRGGRNQTR